MNISIIMARAGSKGIPGKNIKMLGKMPLIGYSIMASMLCEDIDLTVFTTEDPIIMETATEIAKQFDPSLESFRPIERPAHLATDWVETEEVCLHALRILQHEGIHPDAVVALQPPSPFRDYTDISEALKLFWAYSGQYALISVFRNENFLEKGFYWKADKHSPFGEPIAHKADRRVGRQDVEPFDIFRENGSIYIVSGKKMSLERQYRLPPFVLYEMPLDKSVDLDDLDDWARAEEILNDGYRWKNVNHS